MTAVQPTGQGGMAGLVSFSRALEHGDGSGDREEFSEAYGPARHLRAASARSGWSRNGPRDCVQCRDGTLRFNT